MLCIGLERLAAFTFMGKRFSLNDWLKFLSSLGMPLRVGKYEPSAQSEERQILKRSLQMLGSDKAAAIPKNTDIEFLQANNSEGATFKSLPEYLDKQIAVAVLGQTLTSGTEGGGCYALGQVQHALEYFACRLRKHYRRIAGVSRKDLQCKLY